MIEKYIWQTGEGLSMNSMGSPIIAMDPKNSMRHSDTRLVESTNGVRSPLDSLIHNKSQMRRRQSKQVLS